MANKADPELAIKMTTEIAVAYLSRNSIERRESAASAADAGHRSDR
jgi:predicted transcriptional regulator